MAANVYRVIDGVNLVNIFSEEAVRSAFRYKPRRGDIFSASYPKCDSDWLQHIVYNILTEGVSPERKLDFRFRMPFLELQGADAATHGLKPGALRTHLPFQKVPFSEDAKYIYSARNPYDCCVAFYHHTATLPVYEFGDGTFDQFLEMFLRGQVDFGDYFDHLLSWYEHRDDSNVRFLTFEALEKDLRFYVLKIADFMGATYGEKLRKDAGLLDRVVSVSDLESMTKSVNARARELAEYVPSDRDLEGLHPSLLKGLNSTKRFVKKAASEELLRMTATGDWKNHFTAEQVARMKDWIAEKTDNSSVMQLWDGIDLPR
ncbi:unnamed protein product [Ixodes pacificus]